MLDEKIAELVKELVLYEAIRQDFIDDGMHVVGIRTDAVYQAFCARHPEVEVSQRRFTGILLAALNLKSTQAYLDGERGSFYEHR